MGRTIPNKRGGGEERKCIGGGFMSCGIMKPSDDTNRHTVKKILAIVSASQSAGQERLQGIYNYAAIHGDWIVVEVNRSMLGFAAGHDEIREADGIICDFLEYPMFRSQRQDVPFALFCDEKEYACDAAYTFVLRTDNSAAGCLAARAFLQKGLRHLAFVGMSAGAYSGDRLAAFQAEAKAADVECASFGFSADPGVPYSEKIAALRKFIAGLPKPCGVMAVNDDLGRLVLFAAEAMGTKVPDELAVIGVDNHLSICRNTRPPLASIDMNFVSEGYRVAAALDALLEGKPPAPELSEVPPPKLVERISGDYAPADAAFVARARGIIRASALGDVRIDAIARTVGVCRTILDREFKRVVGHTVNREIQLCRLAQMKEYLVKTDLTADQIASVCGYKAVSHAKVFFKRETGLTMRAWRLRNLPR